MSLKPQSLVIILALNSRRREIAAIEPGSRKQFGRKSLLIQKYPGLGWSHSGDLRFKETAMLQNKRAGPKETTQLDHRMASRDFYF